MDGRADVSTQLTAQHKVEVSVVGTELILFPICGLTASIHVLRRLPKNATVSDTVGLYCLEPCSRVRCFSLSGKTGKSVIANAS
jgi:hypothetical protein